MPKDSRVSHKREMSIVNNNADTGINPKQFVIIPFACLERFVKEYRCIWITVNKDHWAMYLQFKNMLEHGPMKGPMRGQYAVRVKLFTQALKEIREAACLPDKDWIILLDDISIPQMLFRKAAEWERNGYCTASGKDIPSKKKYKEAWEHVQAINKLGIQVIFDTNTRYTSTEEWNAINNYISTVNPDENPRCSVKIEKNCFVNIND